MTKTDFSHPFNLSLNKIKNLVKPRKCLKTHTEMVNLLYSYQKILRDLLIGSKVSFTFGELRINGKKQCVNNFFVPWM